MFSSSKLVVILNLLIIVPSVINGQTKGLIEFKNVRPGATVNPAQTNATTIEVMGTIFNENSTYPDVYTNFTEFIRYPPQWRSRQFSCLEPVTSLFDPLIKTTEKFGLNNSIDRSFSDFEKILLNQGKLKIDSKYQNSNYTCILFELCNLKEERLRRNVRVIGEADLLDNEEVFTYLRKQMAVFKTRQGVETDYVASITKGTCLAQIYIYDTDSTYEESFKNYASKKSKDETPLMSATNNTKLETWTKELLQKTNSSLLNFENLSLKNQSEILKHMESDAIRDFNLVGLPKLGEKLRKTTPVRKILLDVRPGDTLNVTKLTNGPIFVTTSLYNPNIINEVKYQPDEGWSMKISTMNNGDEFESSCNYKKSSTRSSDHENDHEDFETFDCMVEENDFGIPAFLTKDFKRMEVRVCRALLKVSVQDPLTIINWNQDFENIGYNVLVDENIIVRYPAEDETHYVSAVHWGDCLYQALVYKVNETMTSEPHFASRLISASGDTRFEDEIIELLRNTNDSSAGLHQVTTNQTLQAQVKERFAENTVLSVNLRSLHAKHPLPQLELVQLYFNNFGNSLQASLLTIFVVMIVTKLLTN